MTAVVPAAARLTLFRLTVEGRSAHASQRERGVCALEKVLRLLQALQALKREDRPALASVPAAAGSAEHQSDPDGALSRWRPTGCWSKGGTAMSSAWRLRLDGRRHVGPD